ncbi:hypothetical protein KW786_00345 [Candidatus Parcubacteria bacterium]|nr:hypothetical protein [Candidatus Parcubacteria bacterium]
MNILEIAQIIFYFTVSFAVIVVGVLVTIIAVQVIWFIVATKRLVNGLHKESVEVYRKVDRFLQSMASLAFFSKFFPKGRSKKEPKL